MGVAAIIDFKTKPFDHQGVEFDQHWDTPHRAVFWEQGTGKTWEIINQAAQLYSEGRIDALVVVAPNGVHANWVTDEIPEHMPDVVAESMRCMIWWTRKQATKQHAQEADILLKHRGLAVLVMAYDSVMTETGRKFLKKFLEKREAFYILDEAARIKTPGSARTKRIVASGRWATRKRVLTGTPVANNPFDVYSLFKFLDPEFWHPLGIQTFDGFKASFGLWRINTERRDGRSYPELLGFRDMPRLRRFIEPHMTRVTKDQVLDLPPKLYKKRPFELSKEQRRLYNQLKDEYMADLCTGELVTAPLAMVRLLRMQQVTCGYLPTESDDEPLHRIPGGNPRLEAMMEEIDELEHKAIVFARFRLDIEGICEELKRKGIEHVRYDGSVKDDARQDAKVAFQKGSAQIFVANPQVAGEGLTLHAARSVFYYSQGWKFDERKQSEDRAHRIGQEHPVLYTDVMAINSVDQRIVQRLRLKQDFSDSVLGDDPKEWL